MFKNLSPSAIGVSGHQSEIIELALTFGFDGFDLDVADFATRARLRGMPYARRLIDSAKIRVGTFQLPFEWDTEDERFEEEVKKLPDYAAAAAEVGCTRCVATLSPAGDKRPYHENFEFHRHRFAAICAALKPVGTRIGLGFQAAEYLRKDRTFQFIHDLDALTLLTNMVDAPNMGLLLDVWEVVACGGSLEAIRSLPAEQIVAVQIADMPADVALGGLNADCRLLPGAENGQIDLAGALMILSDAGYDGPVTVKPSRRVFQTRRRDVVVRQVSEALDKVWRAAGLVRGAVPV
ncbi:MAG: sugar phosphate isomerase/epimerase [Pirellulales bacterium]|nr:sugar phosphate isomerase/epimerase [Pirellulales bacterium]